MATGTMHLLEDDCLRTSTIMSSRTFQGHRRDSAKARPLPPRWSCVRRSPRALTVDLVTWCCRRPGCVAGCPWGAVRRDLTVDVDRRSAVSGYGRLILL